MELIEFGPDDLAAVDAYVAIGSAADAVDCPFEAPRSRFRQQNDQRFGWDGEVGRYFLAQVDGTPVGILCLYAPEHENTDLVWIDLRIAPEHRRKGFGSAALDAACRLALDAGRPLVILEGGWDDGPAAAFATSAGFPLSQVAVRRVQDLPVDLDRVEALRAEAETASAGYDLVRISGRTPPDLLHGLVAATEAINDAPNDDLEYEDEVYDAERIRAFEQAQADGGFRLYRVLAVERATGAVAGHTVVSVYSEEPAHAEQDDTTVVAAHRGHRLGLRLKADMLCWLAEVEPQLRTLRTDNAESNGPMIAVNEVLGYRIAGRSLLFQKRFGD